MTLIAGMTLIDFFEKFHYDDYFKYDANYFLWKYPHMTLIMCMTFIRQSRVYFWMTNFVIFHLVK